MRHTFLKSVLPAAMIAGMMSTVPLAAHAESGADTIRKTIAVVDLQSIMRESSAAKSIQKQIQAKREAYQKQIDADQKKLQSAAKELERQRTVIAADAFEKKRKTFEKSVVETQKKVQTRKRELELTFAASMKKVQDTSLQIISEVSQKRGYVMVLPKAQVILAESKLEITKDVMAQLNKRLPSVKAVAPKKQ